MDICLFSTYRTFPLVAQVTDEYITIATFTSISDEDAGDELNESQLIDMVCAEPEQSVTFPVGPPTPPFDWVDGSILSSSPSQAGRKFRINGHIKLDPTSLRGMSFDYSTVALVATSTGQLYAPFNRTLIRLAGVARPFYSSPDPREITIALLRFGFKSQPWNTIQVILHGVREQGVVLLDSSKNRIAIIDYTEEFKNIDPILVQKNTPTLQAGATADIDIECHLNNELHTGAEVILNVDALSGFTSKKQVLMSGGKATIRLMGTGLEPGDKAIAQIGWGITPSILKIEIQVT